MHVISKRLSIYPALRDMCEFEVNADNSAVRVIGSESLIKHLHLLAEQIIQEQDQTDTATPDRDNVSMGSTLKGGSSYPRVFSDIKSQLPSKRYRIDSGMTPPRNMSILPLKWVA